MTVRWKTIPETYYEVSTDGNVRNINTGRVLKHRIVKGGYHVVVLYIDQIPRTRLISRLVAEAFIPNPDGLSDVDHVLGDKDRNCVCDLQWLSKADNNAKERAKVYTVIAPDGSTTKVFNMTEFCRSNGLHKAAMSKTLHGKLGHHKGYKIQKFNYI